MNETTQISPDYLDPVEENKGAELEIDVEFRRKLSGLRFLPRSARAGARRELRSWRRSALKALREKRAMERQARYELRRKRFAGAKLRTPGLD